MTRKAQIGSISHGTLRSEDLIISFADELRLYEPDHARVKEADAIHTLWASGWLDIYDDNSEAICELISDLEEALSCHAPAFCYFGAHPGDGSDFGFWPDMDAIDELPRVADPAEVEDHAGEECAFVNDHGNVTVYGADGAVLIDFV